MSTVTSSVSATDYLEAILRREAVDRRTDAAIEPLRHKIEALCSAWGGGLVLEVTPGGAHEKAMANRSGAVIDYIVWIRAQTGHRIPEIYESMFLAFERLGLMPVRRDVTIRLMVGDIAVDLLPARRLSMISDIHEIYSTRRLSAITTNLYQHVLDAHEAGRQSEVRLLKLWRDQMGLDFPSYYLELSVQCALRRRPVGTTLAENVWIALGYFEKLLVPRAILDPANAANIVSDELTTPQKRSIALAAAAARDRRPWSQIVV